MVNQTEIIKKCYLYNFKKEPKYGAQFEFY